MKKDDEKKIKELKNVYDTIKKSVKKYKKQYFNSGSHSTDPIIKYC